MLLIARYIVSFISIALASGLVRASASTEPGVATTAAMTALSPKAALKQYNAAMRTGDVAAMVALQYATNDDERRVARSCAQSDMEVGKLISAAHDKFGDDGAKKVSQAVNDEGDAEVDAGIESINGTHGSVLFVGSNGPSPLILVDGTWQIDVGTMLKQYDGTADALSNEVIARGSAAKVTTQELLSGQYASADAMVAALKDRLKNQ